MRPSSDDNEQQPYPGEYNSKTTPEDTTLDAPENDGSDDYLSDPLPEPAITHTENNEAIGCIDTQHDTTDEGVFDLETLFNGIHTRLDALDGVIQQMDRKFDNRLAQDEHKERIIDRMHEELDTYRKDIAFKLLQPLANSMIHFHDQLEDMQDTTLSDTPTDTEISLRQAFVDFAEILRERLEASGFLAYRLEIDTFDANKQQAIRRVDTNDPELDKHVAERVRYGFTYGERIIRPEKVAVYRFSKTDTTEE